jgi:hypothetical protein
MVMAIVNAPRVVVEGVDDRHGKTGQSHDDDEENDEGRRLANDEVQAADDRVTLSSSHFNYSQ